MRTANASSGRWAEVIVEIVEEVVEGTPAAHPAFAVARAALARRMARVQLVARYLEEVGGPLTEDGKLRDAARYELQLLHSVEASLEKLGLTPTAAARLGVDMARRHTIHDELAEAREAAARMQRRRLGMADEAD